MGRRLAQLRPATREIAVLRLALGFTVEETASLCGCSSGTVKRRVSEAESHLKGEA